MCVKKVARHFHPLAGSSGSAPLRLHHIDFTEYSQMTLTCRTILSKVDSKVNPYVLKNLDRIHNGRAIEVLFIPISHGRLRTFNIHVDWVNLYDLTGLAVTLV